MGKLTIERIAEMLNISKSTVSRAFRDSYDINPETKEKILKIAKELNFEPNSIAQSLRDKKTKRIGIIIPSFTIPFYASAICGIQEVAGAEGYNLLICQSDESYENEVYSIKSLLQSRVDGIILSVSKETTNFNHIIKLRDNGIPIVLFNRTTNVEQITKVRVHDYKGSYEMTEYLISKGYRKIAYLAGPKNLILSQNRFKGFKAAMNDRKIVIDENAVIFGDFCIESGMERCEQLLSNFKPDAIYCICDNVAFGVIKYLKENNTESPKILQLQDLQTNRLQH
jgi:LacI family transcriptional regulator